MPKSAANADDASAARTGISLTAVIARRSDNGRVVLLIDQGGKAPLVEYPLEDSSDRALDLYARLKKSKGEGGRYVCASIFLRANSRRGFTKFV